MGFARPLAGWHFGSLPRKDVPGPFNPVAICAISIYSVHKHRQVISRLHWGCLICRLAAPSLASRSDGSRRSLHSLCAVSYTTQITSSTAQINTDRINIGMEQATHNSRSSHCQGPEELQRTVCLKVCICAGSATHRQIAHQSREKDSSPCRAWSPACCCALAAPGPLFQVAHLGVTEAPGGVQKPAPSPEALALKIGNVYTSTRWLRQAGQDAEMLAIAD